MRIVVFGAYGTLGSLVTERLGRDPQHEVLRVGRKHGDFKADLQDLASLRNLFEKIGRLDAVVCAAGEVSFAPLEKLTQKDWDFSLSSKLMGQIRLVQEALPFINENGSFTLISGILGDEPIRSGVAASTVNKALEGFVMAAACELPKNLRINVVSPGLLKESEDKYADFFPGFVPVEGRLVAEAFAKSVFGVPTGKVIRC